MRCVALELPLAEVFMSCVVYLEDAESQLLFKKKKIRLSCGCVVV